MHITILKDYHKKKTEDTVSSFDIATLLKFDPPAYLCKSCVHVFNRSEIEDFDYLQNWLNCPICKKPHSNRAEFIEIKFRNIMEHSRTLAGIADVMNKSLRDEKTPPLRILLGGFLSAESFVHVTSYGLTHVFLGALKLISQAVEVRGFIANASDSVCEEIDKFKDENPNMSLIAIPSSGSFRQVADQLPHQKLIIIDGLLAFAGSTNLTQTAWRSVKKGLDHIQIVTDITDVQDIHDRLFCRHWYKLNPTSRDYSDEVPF